MFLGAITYFLAVLGAQPDPAVAAPEGKWALSYAERYCLAARMYDTPIGKTALRFRPYPIGNQTWVELLFFEDLDRDDLGTLSLARNGNAAEEQSYALYRLESGDVLLRFALENEGQMTSELPQALTFDFEHREATHFDLAATRVLRDAIKVCQDDLRAEYDIPVDVNSNVATPAKDDARALFSVDDYPSDALRGNKMGTVVALYTITTEGRVKDCSIWESSGVRSLDEVVCKVIPNRYRGEPALDADGNPVTETRITPVRFELATN